MSSKWDKLALDIGYELLVAMSGLQSDLDAKASFGFHFKLHDFTVTIKKGAPRPRPDEVVEPGLN